MAATASVFVSSRQHRATWQGPGRLLVALALTGDCQTTCFADKFLEIIFPKWPCTISGRGASRRATVPRRLGGEPPGEPVSTMARPEPRLLCRSPTTLIWLDLSRALVVFQRDSRRVRGGLGLLPIFWSTS